MGTRRFLSFVILLFELFYYEKTSPQCIQVSDPGSHRIHTIYCNPVPSTVRQSIRFYRWNWHRYDLDLISHISEVNRKWLVILVHELSGSAQVWKHAQHRNLIGGLKYATPKSDFLIVDWHTLAAPFGGTVSFQDLGNMYTSPMRNTQLTGSEVAQFLESPAAAVDLSTTHCIGFSLGAHVCGFIGKSLRTGRLGRISDPAGPGFDSPSPLVRLDKSDAEFVDVIHSSKFGLLRPIGHIDFYINDPTDVQPKCLHSRFFGERSASFSARHRRLQRRGVLDGIIDFVVSVANKKNYLHLNGRDICSHYVAVEAFAASCVSSCRIEHCACLTAEATDDEQIFRERLHANCSSSSICSSKSENIFQLGYPAIKPPQLANRRHYLMHGGDQCSSSSTAKVTEISQTEH